MRRILALGCILLTGCSLTNGADIEPETSESSESAVAPESSDGGENAAAPAGVDYSEAPRGAEKGVSLVKSELDRVKDMVSFEGDFVPFEKLGFEQYVIERETSAIFSGYRFAVDNELLYFFEYNIMGDTGPTAEKIRLLAVHEYNVPEGVSTRIEMPEGCMDIIYIDREYILYTVEGGLEDGYVRFVQLDRKSGTTADVIDVEELRYIVGDNCERCGYYLFFTTEKQVTLDDGSTMPMEFLTRYSLDRHETQMVGAAELLGAVGDEVITAPVGSMLNKMHYTLGNALFYASPDELYLGGEKVGYVAPTDRSKVFGERFEAGIMFPLMDKNVYKPVFTTAYGVTVDDFLVSESSAAAICLAGADGIPEALILADTAHNRAAVLPEYGGETDYGFLRCSGDWIYFLYYDGKIVAVNTTAKSIP